MTSFWEPLSSLGVSLVSPFTGSGRRYGSVSLEHFDDSSQVKEDFDLVLLEVHERKRKILGLRGYPRGSGICIEHGRKGLSREE